MSKRTAAVILPFLMLIFLIPFSASWGAADVGFLTALKAILNKAGITSFAIPRSALLILFSVRLPRVLLAAFAGAGLAASGVVFQAVFRNPLAEPYLLGISSGASLGATVAIISGAGILTAGIGIISVSAFIGSVLTVFLVFALAGNRRGDFGKMLLGGIAIGYIFQAGISFMMMLNRSEIDSIVMWMMGSFTSAGWQKVILCGSVVIVCGGFLMLNSRKLNIMSLGSTEAHSLGVDPQRTGAFFLIISCVIIAAIVSVSGIIGFIGLIVPHLMRMITGPEHSRLLPASAAGGACLLILSDLAARMLLIPQEIPVGVITAILGGPFFLYMLRKSRKAAAL